MLIFRLLLFLLFLEVPLTAAVRVEASEVDALFGALSSNEQDADEAVVVSTVTSVLEQEIESAKDTKTDGPLDGSSKENSKNATVLDSSDKVDADAEKVQPVVDLSDRRSWHVPISGGDVIPPAIIPPERGDIVTEETMKDPAMAAVGDPRNWHVPISGVDVIPAAIVPPEGEGASVTASLKTAEVKQSGSGAPTVFASFSLIFLAVYL